MTTSASSALGRYHDSLRRTAALAMLAALEDVQGDVPDADAVVDLPSSDSVCVRAIVALTSEPPVSREVQLPVHGSPAGMGRRLRVVLQVLRRQQHREFREELASRSTRRA